VKSRLIRHAEITLAGLTELDWLFLDKNEISDVEPLASLAKLTLLDLYGNPINNCQVLPEKPS
jgi:Leucine-rich repeat (LRR) protein